MTKLPIHEQFAIRPVERYRVTKSGARQKIEVDTSEYKPPKGRVCVYVIGSDHHEFVKIGMSASPYLRLKSLQTSSPFELRVLCIVEVDADDGFILETEVHRLLRASGFSGRGEWFNLPFEGLRVMIGTAADRRGIKVCKWMGGCTDAEPDERSPQGAFPTRSPIAKFVSVSAKVNRSGVA